MGKLLRIILTGVLAVGSLAAEDFPPIPADTWLIKDEATKGTGAIILLKQVQVSSRFVDTRMRIRIAGEAGKSAAEFASFGKDAYDIVGRTVHPDGAVTPFTKKDLKSKTVVKVGTGSVERTVLIPPGVTADCVVDIRWRESKPYFEPVYYGFGSMDIFILSATFPVRQAIVEVPKIMAWSWSMIPGKAGNASKSERGSNQQFILSDLPPLEDPPYAIAGTRKPATLLLWCNPQSLFLASKEGADAYWDAVGSKILKRDIDEGLRMGKPYQVLSAELRKNRPAGIQDFAVELAKRLDGRIRNTAAPTYEEKARQSKEEAEKEIEAKDLKAAAERGSTNAWGMVCLFYRLLKDEGIHPKIALVADRDRWIFNRTLLTYQQFHDVLIGVEEPGKPTIWIDPAWRFSTPGLISPDYQGTPALSYDSITWKATNFQVPAQDPAINQRRSEYSLDLAEDEDRFSSTIQFSGQQDIQQRRRYMALEPKEQNRLLKERLEKDWPRVSLSKAEVLNAVDPRIDVKFNLDGRVERDAGRRREVEPFPLDHWALWVPDRLETDRTELIVLPYGLVQTGVSRFRIPKGFVLGKVEPFVRQNGYGSVAWDMVREDKEGVVACTVSLKVEVKRTIAPASDYASFKEFLGWIREACGRILILERSR